MDISGRVLFFHANIMKAFDIGRFYTKDALFVWANLGKHPVVHLVMRVKYKDRHKTHYVSGHANFPSKYVLNDALRKVVCLDA